MVRRMLAVAVEVAALALGGCTTSDTPSGGHTSTVYDGNVKLYDPIVQW